MSQVIAHQINFKPVLIAQNIPIISVRNKSPQHDKQLLIQKISALVYANDKLEVKQESLQNTIFDLRKLIQLTRKEGEQTVEILHEQVAKLQQKKERSGAALKYARRDKNHHQKCMLFWNEFL